GVLHLVEGLMNNIILGIHHVISGPQQTLADILFLALGAALAVGGWLLQRSGKPVGAAPAAPGSPGPLSA
uniref:DUF2243 domain-containing protein n=1 Tax=uncultured Arthrobacter sp. TaxID=114050 RepID=UPI0032164E1C